MPDTTHKDPDTQQTQDTQPDEKPYPEDPATPVDTDLEEMPEPANESAKNSK